MALVQQLGGDGNLAYSYRETRERSMTDKSPPKMARDRDQNYTTTSVRDGSFIEDPDAFPHKKVLSWQKDLPWDSQTYKRDESEGSGATIIIIDSGFDFNGNLVSHKLPFIRCIANSG